jgi:hypothetical protein
MPTVTNAGAEPIKWTLRRASAEFGVSVPTLVGKLNEAGETADESKTFSTRGIVTALYGDVHRERFAKLKAEREQVELENAIMRGDFVARVELENVFAQGCGWDFTDYQGKLVKQGSARRFTPAACVDPGCDKKCRLRTKPALPKRSKWGRITAGSPVQAQGGG